jgi:diketogulonate reductase-like aldo/keto reductase
VGRDEIFLTTKVWPSDYARDRVISKTRESLKKLRTDT